MRSSSWVVFIGAWRSFCRSFEISPKVCGTRYRSSKQRRAAQLHRANRMLLHAQNSDTPSEIGRSILLPVRSEKATRTFGDRDPPALLAKQTQVCHPPLFSR